MSRENYLRGATVSERLEFYSMPEPNSGCRLWLGTVTGAGYGQVWDPDKLEKVSAHVASWELANGRRVPLGIFVCHKCDVRACVEPSHLFLGTAAANTADMVAKGRSVSGRRDGRSKLTVANVLAIRADGRGHRIIARDYGVSRPQVTGIKNRRCWAHVP